MNTTTTGTLGAIWRYPVKSMLGESLEQVEVTSRGVQGDRVYAVLDPASGRVLSAKREATLFECHARWDEANRVAYVTLPGTEASNVTDPNVERRLSKLLNRPVVVTAAAGDGRPRIEMGQTSATTEGQASEFTGPPGTFFDSAELHIVTRSSLAKLRELSPETQIDERRFRPNFVVETPSTVDGFIEETWVGVRLQIGPDVTIEILKPCSRCVMVTHAQDELPKDRAVLRTVARRNSNNLGVLGRVLNGGRVTLGDEVSILSV